MCGQCVGNGLAGEGETLDEVALDTEATVTDHRCHTDRCRAGEEKCHA
jgi:hypothetical protein